MKGQMQNEQSVVQDVQLLKKTAEQQKEALGKNVEPGRTEPLCFSAQFYIQ
jgi:hypothetical protein